MSSLAATVPRARRASSLAKGTNFHPLTRGVPAPRLRPADALLRSAAMRQTQPSLVLHFETDAQPQAQAQPMLLIFRREGAMPGADAEGRAEEPMMMMGEDEDDMGAGCAIMTLATLALFVGLTTCCVRAAVAAMPRRAIAAPRQLLVDCSAGELSSPLLVVEERDDMVCVVAHTKA